MARERGYNGWANYATWNVALWIGNDEGLYHLACDLCDGYQELANNLREIGSLETPDGVSWTDSGLDHKELDAMLTELREG